MKVDHKFSKIDNYLMNSVGEPDIYNQINENAHFYYKWLYQIP